MGEKTDSVVGFVLPEGFQTDPVGQSGCVRKAGMRKLSNEMGNSHFTGGH
jgi:hypothetical protein